MVDHSQERYDDSSLSITVNNDQYRGTLGRQHATEALRASQYTGSYRESLPAPVTEIVHQTGHLLSQVDRWNPISLHPRHDLATAASQSAVSQPLLVNISNSKYATMNASSSLAQSLLKNLDMLGKAFSSSTVTYNPTNSITATSGLTPPFTNTPHFVSNTGYGDRVSGSSSHVTPVLSSNQAGASTGECFSLKYCPTSSSADKPVSTAVSSACDPVVADVLKSIGFNFDLSKFGYTAPPKQPELSYPSSVQHGSISNIPPQPVPPPPQPVPPVQAVQGNDLLQSGKNLTTSFKASAFSEIDKMLQRVRERNKGKLHSKSPEQECVRNRRRSSSSESFEDNRGAVKKTLRSTDSQEQKQRHKLKESATDGSERRSGHVLSHEESPSQRHDSRTKSPSPRQHGTRKASASSQ